MSAKMRFHCYRKGCTWHTTQFLGDSQHSEIRVSARSGIAIALIPGNFRLAPRPIDAAIFPE